MGVLILKLNEYRMCTSEENQPLRHITVLEEAHNILKRTGNASNNPESADLQGKSVEMISSSIAEMRTYGEGFIIVDQSPTAVDSSAVKNTNTKIIMRLPDFEDSLIAGRSIGLNDNQIHEIARFPMGVAAVYQNNWAEAVLTKIDKSEKRYGKEDEILNPDKMAALKGKLAERLIDLFCQKQLQNGMSKEHFKELQTIIRVGCITESKKRMMYKALAKMKNSFDGYSGVTTLGFFSDQLAALLDCDTFFNVMHIRIEGDYSGLNKITKADITQQDKKAIDIWFGRLRNNIKDYVSIEDKYLNRLLCYLIIHMRNKNKQINKYEVIYTKLYGTR